jgi:hypothetical protein
MASQATTDDLSRGIRQLEVLGAKLVGGTPPTYTDPPSPIVFVAITALLFGVLAVMLAMAEYNEIRANWAEYQCSPAVMPFAKFYGHDLNATINFCMQQAVKEHAPSVVEPIYKAIGAISTTVDGVFTKAEAVESGVVSLLAGFESFVTNFVNSLRLVGTRLRMSVVRIKEIFGRVHGIFIAFAYAAISALTFGENLACNPLVTFMGTITGVDVCCFAPETRVRMADGRGERMDRLWVGDRLGNGARITSVYRFDGRTTPMVRIDGDNGVTVSAGHYVWDEVADRMVAAADYPGAVPVPSLPILYCLATDTNQIPVVSLGTGQTLICADYEESSDPVVTAAAQRAAEAVLNRGAPAEEPLADYGLGLDPGCRVLLADGSWAPLATLTIGTALTGGRRVAGVIWEECAMTVEVEPGVFFAAAQLAWDASEGRWRRIGRMRSDRCRQEPAAEPRLLRHLLVSGADNSFWLQTPGQQRFQVRDYSEVADDSIQEPYDRAVTGQK